jgi:RNA ligase (TIGR02306 family)
MLGITHYEPEEKGTGGYEYAPKKKRRLPKTLKGWFWYIILFRWLWAVKRRMRGESTEVGVNAPRYDVEALKNHVNAFEPGEMVTVTEKIHGSNARYMFLDGHMYAGSHNLWKAPDSKCIWRSVLEKLPWIEEWCRAHEGFALYGELTPTQKNFKYGSEEPQFFAFDIYTPDGRWVKPWSSEEVYDVTGDMVPILATCIPYDLDEIKVKYLDGPSTVPGAKNVREGVVINPVTERIAYHIGRLQLKVVSNVFYERDSKESESLV